MSRTKVSSRSSLRSVDSAAEVAGSLGLNEHHQNMVVQYMRFARYQRGQRIKAVDLNFQDVKDSRLTEDTFTIDEVEDLLDGLLAVVHGEVETEFINTAHTNVLLLRQLFQQAEKWHLKLQADISELENRELLEKIKDFEDMEFAGAKTKDLGFGGHLEPINDSGGAALLNMEIERLQDENTKLRDRLRQIEGQATSAVRDKSQLKADLDRAQNELGKAKSHKPDTSGVEMDELRRQMSGLKTEMDVTSQSSKQRLSNVEGDLTSTKHELLKIREMLEMAEKELEKKVSLTAPFRNLKSMLQKKNDQIKDLRRRLGKYEDPDD